MSEMFKELFRERKSWIIVKEGKVGIECFVDNEIYRLNKASKGLIKAFLEGVIEEL